MRPWVSFVFEYSRPYQDPGDDDQRGVRAMTPKVSGPEDLSSKLLGLSDRFSRPLVESYRPKDMSGWDRVLISFLSPVTDPDRVSPFFSRATLDSYVDIGMMACLETEAERWSLSLLDEMHGTPRPILLAGEPEVATLRLLLLREAPYLEPVGNVAQVLDDIAQHRDPDGMALKVLNHLRETYNDQSYPGENSGPSMIIRFADTFAGSTSVDVDGVICEYLARFG